MTQVGVELRRWDEGVDDLDALTTLLHPAYRPLADKGFDYLAARQDPETTMKRIERGECWVLLADGLLVGTVTVAAPDTTSRCEWYARSGAAVIGQLAVRPEVQHRGFGARLLRLGERRAGALGAPQVALNTAEGATDLIDWYIRHGYRQVGYADWRLTTNYRSVVLSKRSGPNGDGRDD